MLLSSGGEELFTLNQTTMEEFRIITLSNVLVWALIAWAVITIIERVTKIIARAGKIHRPEIRHRHDWTPWEDIRDNKNELIGIQRRSCRACNKTQARNG